MEASRHYEVEGSDKQKYPTADFVRLKASTSAENSSDSKSDQDTALEHHKGKKNLKEFKNIFKTEIIEHESIKGVFFVHSEAKDGIGIHQNIIDVNKGQIIGRGNIKNEDYEWHLKDIIHSQILLALKKAKKNISQFNLKSWYGEKVIDDKIKSIAERFILQEKKRERFESGSDAFDEIAKTYTARSKFQMLEDYPKDFPNKQVTSITLIKRDDKFFDIDYEFS